MNTPRRRCTSSAPQFGSIHRTRRSLGAGILARSTSKPRLRRGTDSPGFPGVSRGEATFGGTFALRDSYTLHTVFVQIWKRCGHSIRLTDPDSVTLHIRHHKAVVFLVDKHE